MTDKELEGRIAQALARSAPDDLDGVLSRCETRKGTVIPMTTNNHNKKFWKNLIAACLALALVGGGGGLIYQQSYAVASVVSLDVNPSMELNVNKNERVLACVPLNDEAAKVLADMGGGADLKGTKLDVAVNAVVGALVRHGYLDSVSSAILISVEDKDQSRAAKLRQELTQTVDTVLQDQNSGANVLSQTVAKDVTLEQQARDHSITTGKAALVNRVLALNDSLEFDALAQLSVEELRDLVETKAPGMPIGKDAARQAAMDHAGLASPDNARVEVDPELDDRTPHYEVELKGSFGEFDYHVDAYTGQVLSGKADILKPQTTPPAQSQTAASEPAQSQTTQPQTTQSQTTQSQTTQSQTTPTQTTDIGADAAKAAALAHAGLKESQVSRLKAEKDRDDGRLEYEVEFWLEGTEYDYTILAADGSVLSHSTERHGGSKPAAATPPAASASDAVSDIGADGAKAAALAHAGLKESQVSRLKAEKDRDNGRLEYEVEFYADGTEYEYTIDAASGAVLEHEKDRDD